jgi:hypothetical protein
VLSAAASAAILYDPFDDQGRTDGTDPYDTDWYFFSHNSATANPLVRNLGGDYKLAPDSSAASNARMIGGFSDVTLSSPGDYVEVELVYDLIAFNGTKQGYFNLGLFDDGGTPQAEDDMGTTTSMTNDLGYTTRWNWYSNGVNDVTVYDDVRDQWLTYEENSAVGTGSSGVNPTNGNAYTYGMRITRESGGTLEISSWINGGTSTVAGVSAQTYTYNEVFFRSEEGT